jgi:hypothetical protein
MILFDFRDREDCTPHSTNINQPDLPPGSFIYSIVGVQFFILICEKYGTSEEVTIIETTSCHSSPSVHI